MRHVNSATRASETDEDTKNDWDIRDITMLLPELLKQLKRQKNNWNRTDKT